MKSHYVTSYLNTSNTDNTCYKLNEATWNRSLVYKLGYKLENISNVI